MMIGHHQPVARDEGGRAPFSQTGGGLHHMLNPAGVGRKAIGFLQGSLGQMVEGPHPFIRLCRSGKGDSAQQSRREKERRSFESHGSKAQN